VNEKNEILNDLYRNINERFTGNKKKINGSQEDFYREQKTI
jgi:hypothetical protein